MRTYQWMKRQLTTERGASLVEYGFVTILIAIVALVAVVYVGAENSEMYSTIADGMQTAGG